jgi:hypothetical protein
LGEVAGLIGVHASCHGHVVREELEGDDGEEGGEDRRDAGRDRNVVIVQLLDPAVRLLQRPR